MKKRLLVTGATGFIGRNVCEYFAQNDEYEVVGTYCNSKPFESDNVQLMQADLRQTEDVERVMKDVDVVVHAAAVTSGAKDIVERPHIHIADTTLINTQVLKGAFSNKVSQFIFLSCTVMYKPSDKAIKESDFSEADEITPKYFGGAWMKIYFEKMCKFYSNLYPSKFTIVRHSNIYGPHDKYNSEKSHVFAAQITKVSQATDKVAVWGEGKEQRDFLYVDDLCRFIDISLQKQNEPCAMFNVGLGKGTSIRDLVQKIVKASGKDLEIEYDTSKPSIPVDIFLDCSRAKEVLGWEPQVSLEQGIEKSLNYYKENF